MRQISKALVVLCGFAPALTYTLFAASPYTSESYVKRDHLIAQWDAIGMKLITMGVGAATSAKI